MATRVGVTYGGGITGYMAVGPDGRLWFHPPEMTDQLRSTAMRHAMNMVEGAGLHPDTVTADRVLDEILNRVGGAVNYSTDRLGNEHRESGPQGGQFTSHGGGGVAVASPQNQPSYPAASPSPPVNQPNQPSQPQVPPHPLMGHPAAEAVARRMPPAALQRLHGRLAAVRPHPSVQSVTDLWYAGDPNPPPPNRRQAALGFYDPADGVLHAAPGHAAANIEEVIAHEIGHALDQSADRQFFDLSGSPEFLAAWRAELRQGEPSGYAGYDEVEGMGEFARLVYGKDGGAEYAARRFPQCYAVFKGWGLL